MAEPADDRPERPPDRNRKIGDCEILLDKLSRNLGLNKEAILSDAAFRNEVGADELDWIELLVRLEEARG